MANVIQFIRARWGWFALAAVVIVAFIGWQVYQQQQAAQARANELATLRTETIQRGNLISTVSATGSLQPNATANLTFLIPGTVQSVLVKSGDTVEAGQVLARLEAADLALAVSQAEDALRIAELRRKQLLDGPSEDDIAIAKANVRAANAAAGDLARGAGPQEAEIAKLNYDNAYENFRKLNEQYNNLVQFANDYPQFAPPGLDKLKENQETAYYQAEIARLQWEQTKKGDAGALSAAYARINQAKAQLAQLLAKPTEVQVQQADLSVAQAQLTLDQARQRLARAELRAPFAGVVSTVNAKVGEPASGIAVTLLDLTQFLLDVTVNEVDVAQLALQQPVQVTVDALPEAPLTGVVQRIAPSSTVVGGAINYVIRIALDKSEAALRSGMSATVEVTVAEVDDVVLAPNWAIRRDRQTGQAFLSVRSGEELKEILIETGLRGDSYTEVKSGAQPGDEAAISTQRETPFGGSQ
jgi:HlyD family secretion protein